MLNFNWNIDNMLSDLEELQKLFYASNDETDKMFLVLDRQEILKSLNILNYKTNIFTLNRQQDRKYQKLFETDFYNNVMKIKNCIYDNKSDFDLLVNNISSLQLHNLKRENNKNPKIDIKYVNCISMFLKEYDYKLYKNFSDNYKNGYINICSLANNYYNGYCSSNSTNKKSYINIYKKNNDLIMPTIVHESGHSFEYTLEKNDISWKYNINLYSEVFAILITLLFDNYLISTEYYEQSYADNCDFILTNYNLAHDLKTAKNVLKSNFCLNDLIYFYGSNIALSFLEQYNINCKEAKKNIDYFINNNDIIFSNQLLKDVDVDLDKLYSGEYYEKFCYKSKKLTK